MRQIGALVRDTLSRLLPPGCRSVRLHGPGKGQSCEGKEAVESEVARSPAYPAEAADTASLLRRHFPVAHILLIFLMDFSEWVFVMRATNGMERCWRGLDLVLLAIVSVLLACSWWGSLRISVEARADACGPAEDGAKRAGGNKPATHIVSVADARPVSVMRSPVRTIARTLAADSWEGLPSSLATDMRERDGGYEICFALPQRTDPSGVKVSTSGNVLTLFVSASERASAAFVKQFYIPCGTERTGAVETSVSNGIVRVRIRPGE